MNFFHNRHIARITGIFMLCLFSLKLASVVVRGFTGIKNIASVEKTAQDSSSETEDEADKCKKFTPDYSFALLHHTQTCDPYNLVAAMCHKPEKRLSEPLRTVPTPPPNTGA